MTREKWASMTPDQRRIKIAELCGWKVTRHGNVMASGCYGCFGYPPGYWDWAGYSNERVPDYEGDLNAMHEAEILLPKHLQGSFRIQLSHQADPDCRGYGEKVCHATAAQRAEALALTLEPE